MLTDFWHNPNSLPRGNTVNFLRTLYLFLIVFAVPSQGQEPILDFQNRFLPQIAANGMIASPERLAAEAGVDILRRGGNAVDAAVATGFALAVTYPRAGNLGGGGFMLIHLAKEDRQILVDYREVAPAAAHRDMFLDANGQVDRDLEFFSRQSAGVPGSVAGLVHALETYGTMSLAEVIEPAIRLAEKGFPVSYALDSEFAAREKRLLEDPEARRLFFRKDGSRYPVGSILRQKDLAWTLKQIRKRGRDGFYAGAVADRIAGDMKANGGLITRADLANYRVVEREPVRGTFRDFEVVATPPPSSGGVHIVQILNIMEAYPLEAWGHNSAAYLHHLTEAMKLAYADRSRYLGDPAFTDVPVARLADKDYATRLRAQISADRATPSEAIRPGALLPDESRDTTHFTVADSQGNVVSNTYTLNFSFGSHIAVPGTGMLLNNEMADFAAKPGVPNAFSLLEGEANAVEGGKRPLSSMTPTIVFRDGKPWLATGSPGGSRIITAVLQTIMNAMVFDMNVASAAAAARVHHQWLPDQLLLERGISPDTRRLLEAMGHKVVDTRRTLGRTQSIMLQDGLLYGATDGRRPEGWVAGY
jgi:gamma-glutamyltranspeptidase/glutathione hydrolase